MALFMLFKISDTDPLDLEIYHSKKTDWTKKQLLAFFKAKRAFTLTRGLEEVLEALTNSVEYIGHIKNVSEFNYAKFVFKLYHLAFFAASWPQFRLSQEPALKDNQISRWLVPLQLVEKDIRRSGLNQWFEKYDFRARIPFFKEMAEGLSGLSLEVRTNAYELEHAADWENEHLTYYLANLIYPYAHLFLGRYFPALVPDATPTNFHLHLAQTIIYLCSSFVIRQTDLAESKDIDPAKL
jgi:hypothetical protein